MYSSCRLALAVVATLLLMGTAAQAGDRPLPKNTDQPLVHDAADLLPGDRQRLDQVLQDKSNVRYRILVVDDSGGEDKTDYLDRVAAAWDEPRPDVLLLVVYARDNYDIRFFMGANFRRQGIDVPEMLSLVRSKYFTRSQQGDVAGGLINLIEAVNDRTGFPLAFAQVSAGVPADVKDVATRWINLYLRSYFSPERPRRNRLAAAALRELSVMETPEGPIYLISYAVRPVDPDQTDWIAGNGHRVADGWIEGKVMPQRVIRQDGQLRMTTGAP